MAALFPDHPEVISNTLEICDKVENYTIDRGHVLPKFQIDPEFLADIDNQLENTRASLTRAGATKRATTVVRSSVIL